MDVRTYIHTSSLTCMGAFVCRYEELLNEEEVTVQEITAFEKKMDAWTKADDNDQTDLGDRALPKAHIKVSESMPPAVVAFEVCVCVGLERFHYTKFCTWSTSCV